nr:MAG TPA: hypothetical protein [Caudoviricetes sp.]
MGALIQRAKDRILNAIELRKIVIKSKDTYSKYNRWELNENRWIIIEESYRNDLKYLIELGILDESAIHYLFFEQYDKIIEKLNGK